MVGYGCSWQPGEGMDVVPEEHRSRWNPHSYHALSRRLDQPNLAKPGQRATQVAFGMGAEGVPRPFGKDRSRWVRVDET